MAVAVCLFCACSQRHTAISLAEDFIDANAGEPAKIENRDFGKLGITCRVADTTVTSLQARQSELYKAGIAYPAFHQGDTLYYIRMKFTYQGDTLSQTFYLDKMLEHVVAVK
jgi:hypothetical protein